MTQPQQNPWDVVGVRKQYSDGKWDFFTYQAGDRCCLGVAVGVLSGRYLSVNMRLRNGQIIRVRPKR